MATTPSKQNNITELPSLNNYRYENLFNVYQNEANQYFYNLLSKVNFPANMDETYYTTYTVENDNLPWTFISNKFYGTIYLWWIICASNQINNPVYFPKAGTILKILNPIIVRNILQQLNLQQ